MPIYSSNFENIVLEVIITKKGIASNGSGGVVRIVIIATIPMIIVSIMFSLYFFIINYPIMFPPP